jgi:CRISPR-associated protein Cas2
MKSRDRAASQANTTVETAIGLPTHVDDGDVRSPGYDRKAASDFREGLKDLGFLMAQYSVYLKHTSGQRECDSLTQRVREQLPEGGRVYVHCLTDRQYERIIRFEQKKQLDSLKNPEQYQMF